MSFDPGKFVDDALRFADSGAKGNGSSAEQAPQLIARPFVWRDPAPSAGNGSTAGTTSANISPRR